MTQNITHILTVTGTVLISGFAFSGESSAQYAPRGTSFLGIGTHQAYTNAPPRMMNGTPAIQVRPQVTRGREVVQDPFHAGRTARGVVTRSVRVPPSSSMGYTQQRTQRRVPRLTNNAGGVNLPRPNAEFQMSAACLQQFGPTKAAVACTAGALTTAEIDKCKNGIGTRGGCFGPNNWFRTTGRNMLNDITRGPGKNNFFRKVLGF